MPEPTQISFSHKEVVTALLKAQGIHAGIWGLTVRFGIRGMNVGVSDDDLQPTAMVPLMGVSIERTDKINNLSVDAAVVNPAPVVPRRIGAGRTPTAKRKNR